MKSHDIEGVSIMPMTKAEEMEQLVDELIQAARDVEWESHFGARWDFVRSEMLAARAKVIAAMAESA
jgi:hypothetical protein